MSDALTIAIRGHLLPVHDARRLVEAAFTLELQAGAKAMREAIAINTPKRTGNLRDHWTGDEERPEWDGDIYKLAVYNEVVYARRVHLEGKSAGYATNGVNSGKDAALVAIKAGDVAPLLWVDG